MEHSFKKCGISNALDKTDHDLVWEEEEDSSQVEEEPIAMSTTIGLLPNSGRNSSVKAMMKKNSMAFEEKQTNRQTAPLGATKYEKRNDQCFIVLKISFRVK